jgi:ABC-type transporter Mla subunit MlaD
MQEVTRAQKARLGLFLVIAFSLLIGLLLAMTGTKLLEKRDVYFVKYLDISVSGLEVGSNVKYHGVRVGRVEDIKIDPESVETILVTLSLKSHTPVKTDVKAEIASMSLTGVKIIELTGGSSKSPTLPPNSEIPAGTSSLQMITGKAEVVSRKLEVVLTNLEIITGGENQARIFRLIDNTSDVLEDIHVIISASREPLANTMTNLESASEHLNRILTAEAIDNTLAQIDSVSASLQDADFAGTVRKLAETLEQARVTFNHLDLTLLKGRHDLLVSLEVLRESLDSFNEFSRMIAEDPSILLRGTREGEIGVPGEFK